MVILLRPPIGAGTFYELDSTMLRRQLDYYFKNAVIKTKKVNVLAAISPHGSYAYSGKVSATSFANMEKSNFVILGSNHTGFGSNFALMKTSLWKTPIGEALVDDKFADKMIKAAKEIEVDAIPHENEFSIELQIPFLLYQFQDFKFLPILINNILPEDDFEQSYKSVGTALGKILKKNKNWKIVASVDLSRNMQSDITESEDKRLIKKITKIDPKGFLDEAMRTQSTTCGYGVIATTLFAVKAMGTKKSELLTYATTPDIERESTGYASIIFY